MNALWACLDEGYRKIRGDNSIAVVRCRILGSKKERSPKETKRSRGPDNRALARNPPGCALMVANVQADATNLGKTDFLVCPLLRNTADRQECLSYLQARAEM